MEANTGKVRYLTLVHAKYNGKPDFFEIYSGSSSLISEFSHYRGFNSPRLVGFWDLGSTHDTQIRKYTELTKHIRKLRAGKLEESELPSHITLTRTEAEGSPPTESQ